MWKHLKDNRGIHPIWPALIIAVVVVLIVFIGILMLWDNTMFEGLRDEWNAIVAWFQRLFNRTPYHPLG